MRKWFVLLASGALAVGLLAASGSAAPGDSAAPTPAHVSQCATQLPTKVGHFGGIVSAQTVAAGPCSAQNASDHANGFPPLLWWGGPAMGTDPNTPITVTPIFWEPQGYSMTTSYRTIIGTYLSDVAAASGSNNDGSNVYSTLSEYYGKTGKTTTGQINYNMAAGTPIIDTNPLPLGGCTVGGKDRSGIYADGSGYSACVDDAQVTAETASVVSANGGKVDLNHIYVMYLPKGVASCFYDVSTSNKHNVCTIDHYLSAAYCAYHSMAPNGMVYANMPFPVYESPVGYTCGTDAKSEGFGGVIESPNGNPNADTEISPTSHEIMESITDPNTTNGWFDSYGYENGDECAYVWGTTSGSKGQLYNQQINGNNYMTQEEFSNLDFFHTLGRGGCVPGESSVASAQ